MKTNIIFNSKTLMLLGACLAGAGASFAIEWGGVDNLASGSTVTVSSNEGAAATITDNNNGSSWQAQGGANRYAADWALIDLGEEKQFSDIEIMWEASHPTVYSIYVSKTTIPFAPTEFNKGNDENPDMVTYNVIDSAWLAANTPVAKGGEVSESGFTDNLSVGNVTARYILVYGEEYNNFAGNYGSRIFELRVANVGDRESVASLSLTGESTVSEGSSIEVKAEALNTVGETLDLSKVSGLTLTADKEGVEISGGASGLYTVKGVTPGTYTLTLSGEADGQTLTTEMCLIVLYDWSKVENVARGKAVAARVKAEEENVANAVAANATDGDEQTVYEYNGGWGGGDSWVVVDLGAEYVIDAIGTSWGDNSGGTFAIAYTVEAASVPVDADVTPNGLDLAGWTRTETLSRVANTTVNYLPETPVRARYIVVYDLNNPNGKPQYKEIYVKGIEVSSPAAPAEITAVNATEDYLVTGEKTALSATMIDQYGAAIEGDIVYSADGGVIEGNEFYADEVGEYTVTATCGKLSRTLTLNVVADAADKVSEYSYITLNGEMANNVLAGQEVMIPELGSELIIDLANSHDIDLIKIRWEAACPSDYTVEALDLQGHRRTVLEVKGRKFVGGVNPVDRVWNDGSQAVNAIALNGASLKSVKTLVIRPTAKDHGYNLRLFGVDVYGTDLHDVNSGVAAVGADGLVDVYTAAGVVVRRGVSSSEALTGLPAGLYIAGGRKVIVK